LKILYIEDSPIQARTMQKIAQMAECEVLIASTGREGLSMLDQKPDLILLDIGLPDMNGFGLARQINDITPDTPIVATSARGQTLSKEDVLTAHCVDYIPKPWGFMEMVDYLKKAKSR
jgi:DNA-binding response OmpR family regulator